MLFIYIKNYSFISIKNYVKKYFEKTLIDIKVMNVV